MPDPAPVPRPRDRSRPYDVVVWGATGYTGRLVAEYLVRTRSDGALRLALGGRSRSKLEAVRQSLAAIDPEAARLPLEVTDAFDRTGLAAMAAKAEVVCTTVGPYAKFGEPLVQACVRAGTDYCDLTGEITFIRQMIDTHHEAAVRSGCRIVCCCGYDSIPSDIGTLMMQRAMQQRHGVRCDAVKNGVLASKGGFSGGTTASMLEMLAAIDRDPSLQQLLGDPYGLNPEGERRGPDGPDLTGVRFDTDLGGWAAPFVMAAINGRIVRRSNALTGFAYGRDFRYDEVMCFPEGIKGRASAWALAGGIAAFLGTMRFRPTRRLLARWLPEPGEGPDVAARDAGHFAMRLVATGTTEDGQPVRISGRIAGDLEPNYAGTAIMFGEAARCLAVDGSKLDTPGGILTPASAMGEALLERLRKAGLTFAIED